MKPVIESISDFVHFLKNGELPKLNSQGQWRLPTRFSRYLSSEKKQLYKLAKLLEDYLDELEKVPVYFGKTQKIAFNQFIEGINLLEKQWNFPLPSSLKRKKYALLYRLEQENGGWNTTEPEPFLVNALLKEASKWKNSQKIFWRKQLSNREKAKIHETCAYPDFSKLLLETPELKEEFFLWTMREGLPVDVFIQYPAMQLKLVHSRLSGRIGRMGGDNLKILKESVEDKKFKEKALYLPFEGCLTNILDDERNISLHGKYQLTVRQAFEIFKRKPLETGNLEYFAQGITNWNAHRLGWWNAKTQTFELINMDVEDWWFQLPLFEVLTLSEAQYRYGDEADGHRWLIIAKASRQFFSLHYDKNHAYLEIAVPIGDRCYAIYDFGKVATHFPATNWEEVVTFTITILATIAYPDENVYFSHRQHVGYCFFLKPADALRLMDKVREDILQSRAGNVVFQIESENCGHWIQHLLEDTLGKNQVPNLFRIPLIDTEPTGWVAKTFALIRRLPAYTHAKILGWLHLPFGAYKGRWIVDRKGRMEWKSLNTNPYWQDGIIHLPARLHHQREKLNNEKCYVKNELFE